MHENGLDLIDTLQTVFLHESHTSEQTVVFIEGQCGAQKRCTPSSTAEKTIKRLGYARIILPRRWRPDTSQPSRHSEAVAHKINNQASVGGSVLLANLQLKASRDLARQIDRKGAHFMYTYL